MIGSSVKIMMQSVRMQVHCTRVSQSCINLRYYHNGDRITYPEKRSCPKEHKYSHESHKQYSRAIAELKSKKRRDVSIFVENKKIILDLLTQGHIPSHVFYVKEEIISRFDIPDTVPQIQITERQMGRLSDVPAPQGILAIFDRPYAFSADRRSIPLIIYLDKLKDLGNAGTIIRSAAGANCMSVIISPGSVNPWKPAVVRASAGSHYLIPIYENMEIEEVLNSLPKHWQVCVVQSKHLDTNITSSTTPYYNVDFSIPTLMVFGNETFGVSSHIVDRISESHKLIKTHIPINENMDSLNVSMAASILIYEMAKQQVLYASENKDSEEEKTPVIESKLPNNMQSEIMSDKLNCSSILPENDIVDKLDILFKPEDHNLNT